MPVNPGYGPPRTGRLRPGVRRPTFAPAIGYVPAATVIPWTWLRPELEMRIQQPINSARIARANGLTYGKEARPSEAAYGVFAAGTTLDTIVPDDPISLATFLTVYYGNPLIYVPVFTLSLVPRTDSERVTILSREIGDRITLGQGVIQDYPGHTTVLAVPSTLPAGVTSSVIEGIRHESSVTDRVVQWTMAPLLGTLPGQEGPWFRLDVSLLDGNDAVPF